MATNVTCKFLDANPPACDKSYAEYIGKPFDAAQGVYVVIAFIVAVRTYYYTAIIIKRKKFWPLDTQKRMFYLTSIMATTLLIRAIDPNGWRKILPQTIVQLCYDWGTTCFYSVAFFVIFDWTSVIAKVSGHSMMKDKLRYLFNALHIVIWLSWTTCALLQANEENMYLWRAIKLFIGAVVTIFILALQSYFGFAIYRILRTTEKMREMELHKRTSSISSANEADGKPKFSKSKIIHIKHMLRISAVGEVAAILLQLFISFSALNNEYTQSKPGPPPDGLSDTVFEMAFDIIHAFVICVATYFFRPKDSSQEQEDANKQRAEENEPTTHEPSSKKMSISNTRTQDGSKRSLNLQPLNEDDDHQENSNSGSREVLIPVRSSDNIFSASTDNHLTSTRTDSDSLVEQPQLTLSGMPSLPKRPSPYHHRTDVHSRPLPPGWEEFVNEQGLHYYHNPTLQKTVWDFPSES